MGVGIVQAGIPRFLRSLLISLESVIKETKKEKKMKSSKKQSLHFNKEFPEESTSKIN